MKKLILTGAILLFAFGANAQLSTNIYNANGTLTSARTLTLGTYSLHFKPSTLSNGLFINASGFVGINTVSPTVNLDVNGGIQAKTGAFTNAQPTQIFGSYANRNALCNVFSAGMLLDATQKARTFNFYDFPQTPDFNPLGNTIHLDLEDRGYKTRMSFWAAQGSESKFTLFDKNQAANFSVSDDGNGNISLVMPKTNSFVGIGTTSFTDGTDIFLLSVDGNVRARRVKVYTSWADYVFEDDYYLPTLEEVEKHIEEKGHLIDIPSAAEVEANGIELGEMNKLLLQKIEELTLYTIELNKQVQELKGRLDNKE